MRVTGDYQVRGSSRHFMPMGLPPVKPQFDLNSEILELYGKTSFALGQVNEMSRRIPDLKRFIKSYVMKEALLSSAIENIQTTMIDAFTEPLEDDGSPPPKMSKETQLVRNYTHSMDTAVAMLQKDGLPLINRVLLRAHEVLLSGTEHGAPGQWRQLSVRVGELVPPEAIEIPGLMSQLERYINESSSLPPLIRSGLVHVQFETIHPFLDGNGRIGRMLIVLMLIQSGLLDLPSIYPSYYFKKHQSEYYERLDRVRTHGDFEGWMVYYLTALHQSALDAHTRTRKIEALDAHVKSSIHEKPELVKMRPILLQVLDHLFIWPVSSIAQISQATQKAYNTIDNALKTLIQLRLVSEHIVHKRNKLYHFDAYLNLLE